MHPATGLTISTATVATGHLAVFGLAIGDRAVYSFAPDPDSWLALAADKPYWMWLHLSAGVAQVVSLIACRGRPTAGAWSITVMGVWSLLVLAWGVGAARPVSLLGPTLGLVLAACAVGTTVAWTDRATRHLRARRRGGRS